MWVIVILFYPLYITIVLKSLPSVSTLRHPKRGFRIRRLFSAPLPTSWLIPGSRLQFSHLWDALLPPGSWAGYEDKLRGQTKERSCVAPCLSPRCPVSGNPFLSLSMKGMRLYRLAREPWGWPSACLERVRLALPCLCNKFTQPDNMRRAKTWPGTLDVSDFPFTRAQAFQLTCY